MQPLVPTLLLGLGGIGSRIADRVYSMIPEGDRSSLIGVHAFDTNINDISSLEHIGGHVTQTSAPMRVRDYLSLSPGTRDWFPSELPSGDTNHILLDKTLTEGAGQVRAISRLAYWAAMQEGQLEGLERDIQTLLRAQRGKDRTSLRVMVVCSLMGGTGAGMFLQTALYLKDYLEVELGKDNYIIRGAFILPDTLLKNGVLHGDPVQAENVKANAYACLKELEAITRLGDGKNRSTAIELEFHPRQVDALGNPDLDIKKGTAPYKFSLLYDYWNVNGNNIGSFDSYIRQVVKAIYLQLFSPMTKNQFSEEDNKIIELVATGGATRYASTCVATLEYPYEDIVDYCALRWAASGLSSQWLQIDDEYEQELEEWRRDREAGVYRPKPERGERYIKLLTMHATGENPRPFYRQVYASLHQKDEEGRLAQPKPQAFLEALDAWIDRHAESSDDVSRASEQVRQSLRDDRLTDRDYAVRTVERVERGLRKLEAEAKSFVDEEKTALFNQALLRDYSEDSKASGEFYRLNTWILKGSEAPLHPVAVRYFLYSVRIILDERIQTLSSENEDLLSYIKRYEESFNLPDTEETEGPRQVVRQSLDQGYLGRLFRSELKAFAETYGSRARRKRQYLVSYQKSGLKERVFRLVREAVDEMIEQWEIYFRNLREVQDNLEVRIRQRSTEHERHGDLTREFVLATSEDKESLWVSLRNMLASDILLSDDIAREIYVDQYDRLCKKYKAHHTHTEEAGTTAQQFEDTVLAWCRRTLRAEEQLDRNVADALQEEASQHGLDPDDHLRRRIRDIDSLSQPLINTVKRDKEEQFPNTTYWGAHPDTVRSTADDNDKRGTISQEDANKLFDKALLVRDEAFSPYELICYRIQYSIRAQNLRPFLSEYRGPYYSAYRRRLNRIEQEDPTVTPHLDRRWHHIAYLGDHINPGESTRIKDDAERALVLGLAFGFLRRTIHDGSPTWSFNEKERGLSILTVEDHVVDDTPQDLRQALLFHPAAVEQILKRASSMQVEDKRSYPVVSHADMEHHRFYQGCLCVPGDDLDRNLLDLVFSTVFESPGDQEAQVTSKDLLRRALKEILGYYESAYGALHKAKAKSQAADLVRKLMEESPSYEKAGKAQRDLWKGSVDSFFE